MKSFPIFAIGIVSLLAISGLVLMLKTTTIGMGTFDIKPGRAVQTVSEHRPFLAGSPEGLIVETTPRKGFRDWVGKEPCPDGYRIQTKKVRRQEKCIPINFPERYPDLICCPENVY